MGLDRPEKVGPRRGASPIKADIEVGLLRQIMRKYGAWARIQPDVTMLPERQDVGPALTAEQERSLLVECGRSPSRALLHFVVLALETGARYNTIRTLQWGNIDFVNRCLKFGKDKTASGTGRTIPLNQRAMETLKFWAEQFPARQPSHCVFLPRNTAYMGLKERSEEPSRSTSALRTLLLERFNPLGTLQSLGRSAIAPTAKSGQW